MNSCAKRLLMKRLRLPLNEGQSWTELKVKGGEVRGGEVSMVRSKGKDHYHMMDFVYDGVECVNP